MSKKKINFIPIKPNSKQKEPSPAPSPPPLTKRPLEIDSTAAHSWRAMPLLQGDKPTFAPLTIDERQVLGAPSAFVWLDAQSHDSFTKLANLLSHLALSTHGEVKMEIQQKVDGEDYLIFIEPSKNDKGGQLSAFYDFLHDGASLVGGRLYIGADSIFVQYRDRTSPQGYDIPDYNRAAAAKLKNDILLVNRERAAIFKRQQLQSVSIAEIALTIGSLPAKQLPDADELYLLVPKPMLQHLVRYLRRHHVAFRLAILEQANEPLALLHLRPAASSTHSTLPRYLVDYLAALPRVALLSEANALSGAQIFHTLGGYYPLDFNFIAPQFKHDHCLILTAEERYPNYYFLRPTFVDGDQLVDISIPHSKQQLVETASPEHLSRFDLPILLRSVRNSNVSTDALMLSSKEAGWLSQLLYRLPGNWFERIHFFASDSQFFLIGSGASLDGIPFGKPFRCYRDSTLFLPLLSRFVPQMPWHLLQDVLGISQTAYTFLSESERFDFKVDQVSPLSTRIKQMADQKTTALKIHPVNQMPTLAWQPSKSNLKKFNDADRQRIRNQAMIFVQELQGILGPLGVEHQVIKDQPSKWFRRNPAVQPPSPTPQIPLEKVKDSIETSMLLRAQELEENRDLLGAAICYEIGGDPVGSARCFNKLGV